MIMVQYSHNEMLNTRMCKNNDCIEIFVTNYTSCLDNI